MTGTSSRLQLVGAQRKLFCIDVSNIMLWDVELALQDEDESCTEEKYDSRSMTTTEWRGGNWRQFHRLLEQEEEVEAETIAPPCNRSQRASTSKGVDQVRWLQKALNQSRISALRRTAFLPSNPEKPCRNFRQSEACGGPEHSDLKRVRRRSWSGNSSATAGGTR